MGQPMSQDALSKQQWANPKPYITKGGQGKLFPDQKPDDSVRYPRGYTPDRMAEVKAAPIRMPSTTRSDCWKRTSDGA